MPSRKTRFFENESGIFFARHLDSRRRVEIVREIRRSAQALLRMFVASKQGYESEIAQVICPTCRIGHSPAGLVIAHGPCRTEWTSNRAIQDVSS
jgi:hypothetical protein